MIKSIISILSLLWVLLAGTSNKPVHDLRKKPTHEEHVKKMNSWIQNHFGLIALAAIIILLIVFCMVCYVLIGVSAVESGTVYNHIDKIV